jgi:hypothetical protein
VDAVQLTGTLSDASAIVHPPLASRAASLQLERVAFKVRSDERIQKMTDALDIATQSARTALLCLALATTLLAPGPARANEDLATASGVTGQLASEQETPRSAPKVPPKAAPIAPVCNGKKAMWLSIAHPGWGEMRNSGKGFSEGMPKKKFYLGFIPFFGWPGYLQVVSAIDAKNCRTNDWRE